ncbi:diguanylate cyclase [Maridesulfovibrio sp.]|uniref:sensor domain-containing diguanylate cyclase n=1 Tax=Maridesulfovibrio sp. TaxID=2795000 RepID=UPI0039EE9E80
MTARKTVIFILILIFSIAAPSSVFADTPLNLIGNDKSYPLENHFSYLIDNSGQMSLEQILSAETDSEYKPSAGRTLNVGVTDSACWVKFTLHNPENSVRDLVLELGTSTINSATLFIPNRTGGYSRKTTGDMYPIEERDFFHRKPCFSFQLGPQGTETLYLRLKTNAILETSLTILDRDHFLAGLPVEYLLLGMFYAAFIVAIAYNIFLFSSLKDFSRLLYVLYALIFCSLWIFIDGLWHMSGLSLQTFDQLTGARVANAGTWLTMVLFTSWFFNCRRNAPRLHLWFMFIAAWSLINIIMICILPLAEYKTPVRLVWVVSIPSVLFCAALFLKRGFMRARYFLAAWLLVLLGAAVIFMDMYLNIIPSTFISRYAWRIASVFEIILLSLALADRINELNRDKELAQNRALEAEQKLKEGLEEIVTERTKELKNANRKLKLLSQMDELTGLYNRRYFDLSLEREWKRMQRSKEQICLMMIDVDHFKSYNDTYGHQSGDTCLQSIAQSIRTGAGRSSDICARYGGEEFALILPSTDLPGGIAIAENIRMHIEKKHVPHTTDKGIVTASIGVAAITPDADTSPQQLVQLADKALYKSKQQGRNRTSYYAEAQDE